MAIINCPECGKEISDKSETCIYCGYPLKETKSEETPKDETSEKVSIRNNLENLGILARSLLQEECTSTFVCKMKPNCHHQQNWRQAN